MSPTETTETPTMALLRQMDRRLELIETDARRFHQEQSARIGQLDQKIDRQGEILSERIDRFHRESNHRFYWLVGILLSGGTAVLGLLVRLSMQ